MSGSCMAATRPPCVFTPAGLPCATTSSRRVRLHPALSQSIDIKDAPYLYCSLRRDERLGLSLALYLYAQGVPLHPREVSTCT